MVFTSDVFFYIDAREFPSEENFKKTYKTETHGKFSEKRKTENILTLMLLRQYFILMLQSSVCVKVDYVEVHDDVGDDDGIGAGVEETNCPATQVWQCKPIVINVSLDQLLQLQLRLHCTVVGRLLLLVDCKLLVVQLNFFHHHLQQQIVLLKGFNTSPKYSFHVILKNTWTCV